MEGAVGERPGGEQREEGEEGVVAVAAEGAMHQALAVSEQAIGVSAGLVVCAGA